MERKMFWVYLLKCADKSYYAGHTDNLEYRLAQHHGKGIPSCYTATRLPVECILKNFLRERKLWPRKDRLKVGVEIKKRRLSVATGRHCHCMLNKKRYYEVIGITTTPSRRRCAPPQGERPKFLSCTK